MSAKSWDDLLWLYILGELNAEDQQAFSRYLQDCAPCRDELAEWERLQGAVREEVDARVDDLPPLPGSFFNRLDQHAGYKQNGSRPSNRYREEMQDMTSITFEQVQAANANRRLRIPTLSLAAGFATVLLLAALIIVGATINDDPPPEEPQVGAGIADVDQQENSALQTATNTPSATDTATLTPSWTPTPAIDPSAGAIIVTATLMPSATFTPSPTPLRPQASATPIGGTMLPPTVPPPPGFGGNPDPRASITPSVLEPIIVAPATLEQSAELPGGDFSYGIAWSDDGEQLAAASYSGAWIYPAGNLAGSVQLLPDMSGRGLLSVAFSPDGRFIAGLDWTNTLTIWDAENGARLAEVPNAPLWDTPQFLPESLTMIANRSYDTLTITDPDIRPLDMMISRLPAGVDQGVVLAGAEPDTVIEVVENGAISVINVVTEELLNTWQIVPSSYIVRAVLNSDGGLLALANTDGTVQIVDMGDGVVLAQTQFDGLPLALTFTNDDRLAVSVRTNTLNSVWLWDHKGETESAIYVHDIPINDVAVNPANGMLALMSADGRISVLSISE